MGDDAKEQVDLRDRMDRQQGRAGGKDDRRVYPIARAQHIRPKHQRQGHRQRAGDKLLHSLHGHDHEAE